MSEKNVLELLNTRSVTFIKNIRTRVDSYGTSPVTLKGFSQTGVENGAEQDDRVSGGHRGGDGCGLCHLDTRWRYNWHFAVRVIQDCAAGARCDDAQGRTDHNPLVLRRKPPCTTNNQR
ncbi:hypothetical protein OTU49_000796 [Cherax quadricarinatus]|uniref:Uncharacterized protein n=1 Tax=Cherax quadricarinatus TaxID=27406 RepID=A0AAW0XIP6_CHEQU